MVSIATGKENNTTETIAYLELMQLTLRFSRFLFSSLPLFTLCKAWF